LLSDFLLCITIYPNKLPRNKVTRLIPPPVKEGKGGELAHS